MSRGIVPGAMVVAALAVLALLAGACRDGEDASWVDASGSPVPTSTLVSVAGPEHCGWEESLWVYFGGDFYLKDPGHVVYGPGALVYPDGESRPATADDLYQAVEQLPPNAEDTGFRDGKTELWLNPAEAGDAIYLVSTDLVERLPRTGHGCD